MKKIRKQFLPLLIISACALAVTLFFIGLLPFALYPKWAKAAVPAAGWAGFFFVLYRVWVRFVLPHQDGIRKRWVFHTLLSAGLTAVTLSLTLTFSPLYPAVHQITFQTSDPVTFLWFSVEVRETKRNVEPDEVKYIGEWERGDHYGAAHPDHSPAQIQVRYLVNISDPAYYQFNFFRGDQPADVEVTINDETTRIHIPAVENERDFFRASVPIPRGNTFSLFYRVWLALFPVIRFTSLFIFYFLASVWIGSRPSGRGNPVLQYGLLFVLTYLLYNALHFQNEMVSFWNQKPVWLLAAAAAFLLVPAALLKLVQKYPRSEAWLLGAVFAAAVGLRLYWVSMVPTAQVSDFGDFHRWALQLAEGKPGLVMNYYFDFTRLLSLAYRIYPSDRMAVGLNILFSLATMAGLVWICREAGHRQAGLAAAWLFAILPSQIGMTGIVCTDIISTAALVFCAAFLVRYTRDSKWYWLAAAGFCLAAGFMIRGVLIMYAPLFLLPLLWKGGLSFRDGQNRKAIAAYALFGLAGFAAGVALVKLAVLPARVDDMVQAEYKIAAWTLLNGTNMEAKGRNNLADEKLVYAWNRREAFTEGAPLILRRIFSDPIAYYRFLKVKYNHIFANDAYGADLAFLGEDMNYLTFQTNWKYPAADVRSGYAQVSQYAYLCLLGAALAFVFRFRASHARVGWMCLMVLLLAMVGFAFFEVQPRYHIPLMPFLVLPAALALAAPFLNHEGQDCLAPNRAEDRAAG